MSAVNACVEWRALGPVEVLVEGRFVDLGPPTQRALFGLLLTRVNQPVALDRLIDELWSGVPPPAARASLRAYVSNLRRVLEPGRALRTPAVVLRTRAPGYLLDSRGVEFDVHRFADHATVGRDALGRADPQRAVDAFDAALVLWRGKPYADMCDAAWVAPEIARLEELRLSVVEGRCAALLEVGAHDAAMVDLEVYVRANPLREHGCELLALALYRAGRQAEALGLLRVTRGRLAEELGIDPGPALQRLEHDILTHARVLDWQSAAAPPARATITTRAIPEKPPSMTVPPPKTRYAKRGGVSIAYQVVGEGPLDLVFTPGFVSNVDHWWEIPNSVRFIERLASFSRLIIWDKRGTGLSDPSARVPTLEERVDDLGAVLDSTGSERAVLFGVSEGGPMNLLFAATHPERTAALVLYGTSPKFYAGRDWPWGWQPEEVKGWLEEIDDCWGDGALIEVFAPTYADNEAYRRLWGRYLRAGASPAMGRAVVEALRELDCREILPAIRVPTLIVHRVGDRIASVNAARYMAQRIAGAKLVELPGEDHVHNVGDQDSILDEIEEFLTGMRRGPEIDRVLLTVLVIEIVGSTERAAEMGDQRWREVLQVHADAVRREITRFDGREVRTTEDVFLVAFSGPSRAIRCACAIRHRVLQLGIQVRAGLHTGECELIGDNVGGLALHIGTRVAALAAPNEILLSNTVKDLTVGSGLQFEDRGAYTLRGVPGEWHLFTLKS